jgi:Transglycosylase SLT domain
MILLSWEQTTQAHPERAAWSRYLISMIQINFSVLSKAIDLKLFYPNFDLVSDKTKTRLISEIFVAVAKYESGFNPASASVDVGNKSNKDTWSVGLFQMSVVDQPNYHLPTKYKYDDLLQPIPNIDLAVQIMTKQVLAHGVFIVPSHPYWATLYNGKYSKIKEIIAYVQNKVQVNANF